MTTPQMSPLDALRAAKEKDERSTWQKFIQDPFGSNRGPLFGPEVDPQSLTPESSTWEQLTKDPFGTNRPPLFGPDYDQGQGSFVQAVEAATIEKEGAGAPVIRRAEGQAPGLHHISVASFLKEDKEDWEKEIAEGLADERNQLNESFGDVLTKLRRDLSDLRDGRTDVNRAYASYQNAVDTISKQAVIDAPPLDPTEVVAAVGRSYDHAEGALNDALLAIDTSGNTTMAKAMNAELRFWEGSLTRALTSKVDMQETLHQSASDYGRALAQAAFSDDMFQAEKSRSEVELQLLGRIREKQQQMADQKAAQARAMAKLKRSQEEQEEAFDLGDIETQRRLYMIDSVMEQGFDEVQAVEMVDGFLGMLPQAMGLTGPGGQANESQFIVGNEQDWIPYHQAAVNQQAMQMTRLPDGRTMWQWYNAAIEHSQETIEEGRAQGDPVIMARGENLLQTMVALLHNMDFRSGAQIFDDVIENMYGVSNFLPFINEGLPSIHDRFFSTREGLWRMYEDFGTQWSASKKALTG